VQHYAPLLETSVEYLKGVGPQKAELLRKELGIFNFGDLLYHFPYRYLDSAHMKNIQSLTADQDWVQLRGTIAHFQEEGTSFRKRLRAVLYDASGQMELIWFQGADWIRKGIQEGQAYTVFGKLSFFNGQPCIVHPELEPYQAGSTARGLQPVYPTTEKLKAKGLSNRAFAKLLRELCNRLSSQHLPEILPEAVVSEYDLLPRYHAFMQIHFPENEVAQHAAERRLKWEELFLLQLRLGKLRVKHHQQAGFSFSRVGNLFHDFFEHHLPFQLTEAQKRVIREIRSDTLSGRQMNRLLQGDVGSGKTMVALMSMLLDLDNGFQAVLMAPTEILAQQHVQGIAELLKRLDIPVALLTGSVKGKQRKAILEGIATGAYPIVIGTHALLEDSVRFQNLGLAVIDEQHRFGVTQRARLWQKNTLPPHILVMTATPIPRTLAMSVYGDLDVSVIDELPPGRKPIHTIHRSEGYRPQVMQFLRSEIEKGRQIYIVYPLIDESEKMDYESLMAGIMQVKTWFPEPRYRVAMVHGKQAPDERQRNMERFVKGDAHILVATTVIEVGVNVPNASVMIIESAQRFGLSQLHQLRGRVGRGSEKSYCILLTGLELSRESRQRMDVMVRTSDGFEIAGEDLKMRGPGDIYGTRQSGALDFKIADIVHDTAIIEETHIAAEALLNEDPLLEQVAHRALAGFLQPKSGRQGQAWSQIS
jgi:ATP-dependent DNA helicase RecG